MSTSWSQYYTRPEGYRRHRPDPKKKVPPVTDARSEFVADSLSLADKERIHEEAKEAAARVMAEFEMRSWVKKGPAPEGTGP